MLNSKILVLTFIIISTFSCLNCSKLSLTINEKFRANQKPIDIAVYYETRCPDSRRFILNQIAQAHQKFSIVANFIMIPFGKANYTWDSDKDRWIFQCQHKEMECYGNTIHNCHIHRKPKFEDHFPFIACTMENFNKTFEEGALECAEKHSVDYTKLKECADSHLGNTLLYVSGDKTNNLDPQLNYVPWININGLHSNETQEIAEKNLTYFICTQLQDTTEYSFCPKNAAVNVFQIEKSILFLTIIFNFFFKML